MTTTSVRSGKAGARGPSRKRGGASQFGAAVAGAGRPTPILMYHSVRRVHPGGDPNGICVTPERFEEQMRALRRMGHRGVSVGELMASTPGERRRRGLVGVTFDDGYEDFLSEAVPILEARGFGATVFALAGMLGGENLWDTRLGAGDRYGRGAEPLRLPLMDAQALLECEARGMEVASHGLFHRRLPELSDEGLFDEVARSRRVLGRVLGREVEGFCYPYGAVDGRVARVVREAGYRYAVSHKLCPEGNAVDLARLYVGEGDWSVKLGAKLALARRPGALRLLRTISGLARSRPRARDPSAGRGSHQGRKGVVA